MKLLPASGDISLPQKVFRDGIFGVVEAVEVKVARCEDAVNAQLASDNKVLVER